MDEGSVGANVVNEPRFGGSVRMVVSASLKPRSFPAFSASDFVINFKAPSGTKLDATEEETARLEGMIRNIVSKHGMNMIVSNIGVNPGFSALYSPNSGMHTGFMQAALQPDHKTSSFT
jgi:multidrug efflux pump subunit AcrB